MATDSIEPITFRPARGFERPVNSFLHSKTPAEAAKVYDDLNKSHPTFWSSQAGQDALSATLVGCCATENVEMLRYLVNELKTPVDVPHQKIMVPIFFALAAGREKSAFCLIDELGVDPNSKDPGGRSVLYHAMKQKMVDLVKYLIVDKQVNIFPEADDKGHMIFCHLGLLGLPIEVADCLIKRFGRDAVVNTPCTDKSVSLLMHCAFHDQYPMAEWLIDEARVDVMACDDLGRNALHYAAMFGASHTLTALVFGSHIPVNSKDKFQRTPLHYLCGGGKHPSVDKTKIDEETQLIMLKMLVDANGDWKAKDAWGRQPVDYAKKEKWRRLVEFLVELAADYLVGVQEVSKVLLIHTSVESFRHFYNTLDTDGQQWMKENHILETALIHNAKIGQVEMLRHLMTNYSLNVNWKPSQSDSLSDPALVVAVAHRQEDAALYLVECGADPHYVDGQGRNVIDRAIEKGLVSLLKHLVSDPNVDFRRPHGHDGHNSICSAAFSEYGMMMVEILIQRYGREILEQPCRVRRCSLLMHASIRQRGQPKMVSWLLKQGSDPMTVDREGATALHRAAQYGHVRICKILLDEAKIPVNVKDKDQATPLHRALVGIPDGDHHSAAYLRDLASSDFEKRFIKEREESRSSPVVKLLVEKGADIHAKDGKGYIPLDYAKRKGWTSIADYLTEKGYICPCCERTTDNTSSITTTRTTTTTSSSTDDIKDREAAAEAAMAHLLAEEEEENKKKMMKMQKKKETTTGKGGQAQAVAAAAGGGGGGNGGGSSDAGVSNTNKKKRKKKRGGGGGEEGGAAPTVTAAALEEKEEKMEDLVDAMAGGMSLQEEKEGEGKEGQDAGEGEHQGTAGKVNEHEEGESMQQQEEAEGEAVAPVAAVEEEEEEDEEDFLLKGAPDEYKCPVSFRLMVDPVMAPDGRTYAREALQGYINYANEHGREFRSPMTGEPIPAVYYPNINLRTLISDYMEKKREERRNRT